MTQSVRDESKKNSWRKDWRRKGDKQRNREKNWNTERNSKLHLKEIECFPSSVSFCHKSQSQEYLRSLHTCQHFLPSPLSSFALLLAAVRLVAASRFSLLNIMLSGGKRRKDKSFEQCDWTFHFLTWSSPWWALFLPLLLRFSLFSPCFLCSPPPIPQVSSLIGTLLIHLTIHRKKDLGWGENGCSDWMRTRSRRARGGRREEGENPQKWEVLWSKMAPRVGSSRKHHN